MNEIERYTFRMNSIPMVVMGFLYLFSQVTSTYYVCFNFQRNMS